MYHIDWFLNVEQSLHPWNNVLLDSICKYLFDGFEDGSILNHGSNLKMVPSMFFKNIGQ